MNTPEQLADQLTARQASGLWYRSDDAAAELRRLAVENKALRAEAMRFRDDALNEKAARKAVEADRAERQGEAVPFGYLLIDSAFHTEDFTRLRPEKENPTEQVIALYAHPAPAQQPLTEREIELIDGMIEVQLDHAGFCDTILSRPNGNHAMAGKQKGWDMERVRLLRKLKEVHGTGGDKPPEPPNGWSAERYAKYQADVRDAGDKP